MTEGAGQK